MAALLVTDQERGHEAQEEKGKEEADIGIWKKHLSRGAALLFIVIGLLTLVGIY